MPVTISNSRIRADPVPAYHYLLLLEKVIGGWFTECSNITIERAVEAYPEGGVNHFVHQLPGRLSQARVTLKHGLVDDALWRWFQQGAADGQVDRRHISIVVYDSLMQPVIRWNLFNAYPVRWTTPALKSEGQKPLVEEVEFAYDGGSGNLPRSLQRAVQRAVDETTSPEISPDVDVHALARKVYRLLKEELRLNRERQGRRRR